MECFTKLIWEVRLAEQCTIFFLFFVKYFQKIRIRVRSGISDFHEFTSHALSIFILDTILGDFTGLIFWKNKKVKYILASVKFKF
jgi:hypothetical protein